METDVKVPYIAGSVSIIVDRLQKLEGMVVDISEASQTRVGYEWHCAAHHHSNHVPCWRKRPSKNHQFSPHSSDCGYDSDYVLHSPDSCPEGCNRLLVKVLKSFVDFLQYGIIGVNCDLKKDVKEQVR